MGATSSHGLQLGAKADVNNVQSSNCARNGVTDVGIYIFLRRHVMQNELGLYALFTSLSCSAFTWTLLLALNTDVVWAQTPVCSLQSACPGAATAMCAS